MSKFKVEFGYLHFEGIAELVEFGLPVRKGLIQRSTDYICFAVDNTTMAKSEANVVSTWPCGSAKWLHVRLLCDRNGVLAISSLDDPHNQESIPLFWFKDEWRGIEFGDNNAFSLSEKMAEGNYSGSSIAESFESISLKPESIKFYPSIRFNESTVETDLKVISAKIKNSNLLSQMEVKYELWYNQSLLSVVLHAKYCSHNRESLIKLKIHNTNAALHQDTTWDLGDQNSIYITDFSLNFETNESSIGLLLNEQLDNLEGEQTFVESSFKLEQLGSGGDNWRSPIHWDENKKSTAKKQGFSLFNQQTVLKEGLRCSPLTCLYTNEKQSTFELLDFWQNFPNTILCSQGKVKFQLFHDLTELQGGESKSWNFKINCQDTSGSIRNSLLEISRTFAKIDILPSYINETHTFPHLWLERETDCLSPLIEEGIDGINNFFEKREKVDVYGWRNYGDLYADHEVPQNFEGKYFVSHYNNQYDPLYGMTLQYLMSSNNAWLKLIEPLSLHIQDIDIYDTELDKGEYNGGLMWHTDHYLPAETCTHRSNSKHHSYAYDGFLGGGGPGGQHCYTTGLLWQYLFFADPNAKEKVLQLTNWVRRFYNGSDSLVERTFRFLTIDLKNEQLTMIGRTFGGYRYPLDRGTGNYLVALIDSYEATHTIELIKEIGFVIRNTVHPFDDLKARDLKNVEDFWFYTVFFQALGRFLFLKEMIEQIDEDYHYARQTLMHYANWMLVNEDYYLNNPEILEFPNDTWCAQDIRKANIFYISYYFSSDSNKEFIKRADQFYEYIVSHLQTSAERQHTRILAILMQNDGVFQMFNRYENNNRVLPTSKIEFKKLAHSTPPKYSVLLMLTRYCKDMIKLLPKFSVKNEWHWLKFRVSKIF